MVEATGPQRVIELREELSLVAGAPTYREWELLHVVYAAYIGNANDLLALVTYPRRDPEFGLKLMDPDPTAEAPRSFHQELLRLLINYSATVSTLVDHSRNFIRRYRKIDPRLHQEYVDRLLHVVALDVAHFVQGLRNYLLHYQLPSVTTRQNLFRQSSDLSIEFRLDSAKLLAWASWKPRARSYLQDKESVSLVDATSEYTSAIRELYEWLFSQAITTVQQTADRKMDLQTELVHLEENSPPD